ncbi:MAG: hypothetical protein AAF485_30520, partial [Chloroflexota bacterium]
HPVYEVAIETGVIHSYRETAEGVRYNANLGKYMAVFFMFLSVYFMLLKAKSPQNNMLERPGDK